MKKNEILITGGTGTLGKAITTLLCEKYHPKGIRIFSRDEFKQNEMEKYFLKKYPNQPISYLLGDIRDSDRLKEAIMGVDIIINTAAIKQVPKCEKDPIEAIKTNINGCINIIRESIFNNVKLVMHISTDKAVYPINLYGMTKAVAEKLFIRANTYSPHGTKFSCCRYGNVMGSRGSVIPLFLKQKKTGVITITDRDMTRFWITIEEVAEFVIQRALEAKGGEIFIPKMPSSNIIDIAKIIAPNCKIKEIGMREGEKLHECLISEEESYHIRPLINDYFILDQSYYNRMPFTFNSKNNPWKLNKKQLEKKLEVFLNGNKN